MTRLLKASLPLEPRPLVLQMRRITKHFPGVLALDRVNLDLQAGEIVAVMGENGAGKSTLMKVLGGAHMPDEGEILLDGKPAPIHSIAAAKAMGISLIYQELMLAPNLDVASNIFLGTERTYGLGTLDRARMELEAEHLLRTMGLDISPRGQLHKLTTGQMQMVEICKALNQKARILVLDEPTSSLSLRETERLLNTMANLRDTGISMLYISHRMEEVFQIADRIVVLRDGCFVGELKAQEATSRKVVSLMVGRELAAWVRARKSQPGETILSVDNVQLPGTPAGISFEARRGEILGFAGLVGAGRTELMQVLAGVVQPVSGRMQLYSRPYAPRRIADAIRCGVYLVPEDRKLHGLVLSMSIAENISLPDLKNYRPRWRLNFQQQADTARAAVRELQIRPTAIDCKTVNLSGGNQQKVVLAKWLAMRPQVLVLDEPTRGIDVGVKAELYERIVALADAGLTILLVSSDLEEVMALSDRVVVMRNKRIAGVLPREQLSKESVGLMMTSEGIAT